MAAVQPSDSPAQRSSLWKLLGCVALILVIGSAISPLLYWFGKGLLKSLHESGFASYAQQKQHWLWSEIARADFPRFFNRSILLAAVVVLPFYILRSGMDRTLLPSLKPQKGDILQMGAGFALAAVFLLEMGYLMVKYGIYTWRTDAPWLGLGPPLTAALSVALVEEIVFRGFIYGLLARSMSATVALWWTTGIFAAVHFMKPADGIMPLGSEVHLTTGFWLAGQILANFAKINFLLAEFLTLAAIGWALTKARADTGTLWLSIGLHAGWVFGLKYFSALTKTSKAVRLGDHMPWFGENLRVGLVSFLVVTLTGWLAIQAAPHLRRKQPSIT